MASMIAEMAPLGVGLMVGFLDGFFDGEGFLLSLG